MNFLLISKIISNILYIHIKTDDFSLWPNINVIILYNFQRRSAMAERIRLREEWSELKGPCNESDKRKNVLVKKPQNVMTNNRNSSNTYSMRSKNVSIYKP